MTVEGKDGRRYLADRQGRAIDDAYDGPARYVDADGERIVVMAELDPNSAAIVRAMLHAAEAGEAERQRYEAGDMTPDEVEALRQRRRRMGIDKPEWGPA